MPGGRWGPALPRRFLRNCQGAPARSRPAAYEQPPYSRRRPLAQGARVQAERRRRRRGGAACAGCVCVCVGGDSGRRAALSAWRARREAAGGSRPLLRPAALRRLRSVSQDGVAVVVVGGGRSAGGGGGAAGSEGRDEAGERRQRVAGGSRPAGDRA